VSRLLSFVFGEGGEPMRLSKSVALLILLATLIPLADAALVLASIAAVFGGLGGDWAGLWFDALKVLHTLCILWIWVLLAFYLVFLFRSAAVSGDKKVLWAVVLFLASVLAMPVFWYLYIWRPVSGSAAGGSRA